MKKFWVFYFLCNTIPIPLAIGFLGFSLKPTLIYNAFNLFWVIVFLILIMWVLIDERTIFNLRTLKIFELFVVFFTLIGLYSLMLFSNLFRGIWSIYPVLISSIILHLVFFLREIFRRVKQ